MAVDPSKLKTGQWIEYGSIQIEVIRGPLDGNLILKIDKGLMLERTVYCIFWEYCHLIGEDG